MNIVQQLGVDHTVLFQLGIFVLTIVVLAQAVFKPYNEALAKREERTVGSEDQAQAFQQQSVQLYETYETKARSLNDKIREIFEGVRKTAATEIETLISKTRAESQSLVEQTRSKVAKELSAARAQLKEQTPKVASEIAKKLLSDNQRAPQ